mmetsp:Transcript_12407/g.21004  ORF Transcript_12407/g.21004 Transcript_12407/m.21004 type:complete len:659 (+) Transcript_12407:234-2210(+)|eukprot:CAMPEP_0184331584 /NCGR_PEP_ID=MMETSP1089-20130417/885_1 /TAXON_ID=38269 ORGANISM="Gloeochaete wittrockiana, Strain SAG46.84" /NCGR_SAMPLE_ID=MMETSP1089 /ASSEMBLY_ACC=CAM_ASM_000445 /LENGTH=658 /DNA_ID=CAMNT_0026654573 /DNA_START=234 /DNA_END=2210 /DNA_ORIENTATION=-
MYDPAKYMPLDSGVKLSWQNLCYELIVKEKRKKVTKQIVKNATGSVEPGSVLAIMGPSGSGKTSLLNLLADRAGSSKTMKGDTLVNDKPRDKYFKRLSGYVMQDDVLRAYLTVQETLMFAAQLRLPSSMSNQQKAEQVTAIVKELNLTKAVNTFIGNTMKRGISGGEKKRVAIACELITNPMLLFLDEPTSGLDATSAFTLMQVLRDLASRGRTIVTTVHQPRSNIFTLFDKLMLMSEGNTVYFGTASEAINYFGSLGFKCPAFVNPADFFIDVISEAETKPEGISLAKSWAEHSGHHLAPSLPPSDLETGVAGLPLEERAAHKEEKSGSTVADGPGIKIVPSAVIITEISQTTGSSSEGRSNMERDQEKKMRQYANGWLTECSILFRLQFWQTIRNPFATTVMLGQTVFLAILTGLIYLRIGTDQRSIQDRAGVLFFVITNQAFGALASLTQFLEEREVFVRERTAGAYRTSSFFLSTWFMEFPERIIFPFIFSVIVYWMVGLNPQAGCFFIFFVIVMLVSMVASSYTSFVGTLTGNAKVAQAVSPIFIVIMLIFGGFFINTNSIPVYFIWLQYLSFFKYSYEAAIVNEFTGLTFTCDASVQRNGVCPMPDGQYVIYEYLKLGKLSIWANILVLVGMVLAYRLAAYLSLLRLARRSK